MPTGRVKWFSLEKGFGFISNDEGEDVYLSADALPSGVTTVKPAENSASAQSESKNENKMAAPTNAPKRSSASSRFATTISFKLHTAHPLEVLP